MNEKEISVEELNEIFEIPNQEEIPKETKSFIFNIIISNMIAQSEIQRLERESKKWKLILGLMLLFFIAIMFLFGSR